MKIKNQKSKIKNQKSKIWIVVASLAWISFSCDEFCEVSNRTAIVVNFFSLEDDEPLAVDVIVTGINVAGAERDSVLYPSPLFPQSSRNNLLLPINPEAGEMIFSIERQGMDADTIIFRYTPRVGFISTECGCVVYAQIHENQLEWTRHAIVEIEVTNPNAGTVVYRQGIENEENIRIYY